MTVPRVLLLTGTPPGSQGVGGIFLHDLCSLYPRKSICCFAITRQNIRSIEQDLEWLPIVYATRPRQRGVRQFGSLFNHISGFVIRQYVKLGQTPSLIARVVKFGRQQGVEMVWAILNDPIIINIASEIALKLDAQLVITIWDPPERLSMNLGYDHWSGNMLLNEFKKVLRKSIRCSVASEEMKEEYVKRYGIDSVVLIHGLRPSLRRPPAKGLMDEKRFVIGFAGSLYAREEWKALLSALSKLNWQLEGRNIVVRVLGSNVSFHTQGKMNIEYLGWRSIEETVELMSQVDITYLPYWFDEAHRLSARLCFPNKLSTYLAAGKPILFHGPEDSSPACFFHRFPVGLCCYSLRESELIESLRRFIIDSEFYAIATQAGARALDQELALSVFRKRFATLIGIEEDKFL